MSSPVAQTAPNVTLFLPSIPAAGMKAIGQSVAQLLRDLGLPVQSIDEISPDSTRFITRGPEVLVTLYNAPMEAKLTDDCERPEHGQALDQYALRKLELHRAVIGICIEDHRSKAETRNRQTLALTLRLARGLIGETGADLVLWEQNRVLYTVGEFSGLGQPSRPRRPLAVQRQSAPASPQTDLTGADAALAAAAPPPSGSLGSAPTQQSEPPREGLHRRVEDIATPLHEEALRREGGLMPSSAAMAAKGAAVLAEMPKPLPKRPKPPARLRVVLRWFGDQFDMWLDENGMPSRKMMLSVYLLTALAALLSLPVGIALAGYNILRRESLKVTVPTVLGLALAQASGWLDKASAWAAQLLF